MKRRSFYTQSSPVGTAILSLNTMDRMKSRGDEDDSISSKDDHSFESSCSDWNDDTNTRRHSASFVFLASLFQNHGITDVNVISDNAKPKATVPQRVYLYSPEDRKNKRVSRWNSCIVRGDSQNVRSNILPNQRRMVPRTEPEQMRSRSNRSLSPSSRPERSEVKDDSSSIFCAYKSRRVKSFPTNHNMYDEHSLSSSSEDSWSLFWGKFNSSNGNERATSRSRSPPSKRNSLSFSSSSSPSPLLSTTPYELRGMHHFRGHAVSSTEQDQQDRLVGPLIIPIRKISLDELSSQKTLSVLSKSKSDSAINIFRQESKQNPNTTKLNGTWPTRDPIKYDNTNPFFHRRKTVHPLWRWTKNEDASVAEWTEDLGFVPTNTFSANASKIVSLANDILETPPSPTPHVAAIARNSQRRRSIRVFHPSNSSLRDGYCQKSPRRHINNTNLDLLHSCPIPPVRRKSFDSNEEEAGGNFAPPLPSTFSVSGMKQERLAVFPFEHQATKV